MINLDRLIIAFDNGLRTLLAPAHSSRPAPDVAASEAELSRDERTLVAALMRVNHAGEICAQALYQGQALTARDAATRRALEKAAAEETDHLAWTAQRIHELEGRTSALNPVWYAGSFAVGAAAGLLGDKWSLGFLAETERQVEGHLGGHLTRLPPQDQKSRLILEQMQADESTHARTAFEYGAGELPWPMRVAMQLASKVMTKTAFWI